MLFKTFKACIEDLEYSMEKPLKLSLNGADIKTITLRGDTLTLHDNDLDTMDDLIPTSEAHVYLDINTTEKVRILYSNEV